MTPASTIAHYRILAKIGEGGMGAVYRATDTKLNREVAIKILPDAFASDADRLARFSREAQVLASLNHPNIAAIYGVEERAIVMELVEGSSPAGPMAVEEALPLIEQMIDALEYAHEKGVVHRDLKPANLKITPERRLKVLDFGLAKALANEAPAGDPGTSPTITMGTMAGVIMGTASYMSPEQARGHSVDKRADIWSFGVVVYELLTGKMLFDGDTVSDTLAAVLRQEIELDAVPARFRKMLRRCLIRDPRQRLRDISGARLLLEEEPAAPPAVVETRRARWPYAALAVMTLLAAMGWYRATRPVERPPVLNASVDLGADAVAGALMSFALSPDGKRIVYLEAQREGQASLAVRELNQAKGTVLAGTLGAQLPFFSPDGQWVGFFADNTLKKIPVAGGSAVAICDAPNGRGADWGQDGRIVFVPERTSGLFVVSEDGGTPQPLTKFEAGEVSHRWPQWLPGGEAVIFGASSSPVDWDNATVASYSLKTRQRKILVRGGYFGRYLPKGYLVYEREGKLFGIRFNASRLETSGSPQLLVEGVAGHAASGGGQFDLAHNGLLVYLAGTESSGQSYRFGWMAAGGKVEPVKDAPPGGYWNPRLSPDGKRLALTDWGGYLKIWNFERETMMRLPVVSVRHAPSVWTPDGRHLLFPGYLLNYGIWYLRADGSGEPVKVLADSDPLVPSSLSPDGRLFAYTKGVLDHSSLWIAPVSGSDTDHFQTGAPEPVVPESNLRTAAFAQNPMFSPDGRWLAYDSTESGNREVFVRAVRGSGKWEVSSGGGSRPKWSRDGRELFFDSPDDHVMVADCGASGGAFSVAKPRRWSETPISDGWGAPNFDVSADGKRILAFPASEGQEAQKGNLHVMFVVGFGDEVRRRLP